MSVRPRSILRATAVCVAALAFGGEMANAADARVVVGVLELEGDAAPMLRSRATAALRDAVGKLGGVELLAVGPLRAAFGHVTHERFAACPEDRCRARALSMLRADRFIFGDLDERDDARRLSLRLVESSTSTRAGTTRIVHDLGRDDALLATKVAAAVADLFADLPMVRADALAATHGTVHAQSTADREKKRSVGPWILAGASLAAAGGMAAFLASIDATVGRWSDACPAQSSCVAGHTLQRRRSDDASIAAEKDAAIGLGIGAAIAAVVAVVWYAIDPGQDAESTR